MSDPIPWLILLPLLWGLLSFLLGVGRGGRLAIVCLVIQLALVALLVGQVVAEKDRYYAVGGWSAPLGIDLHVDGLASVMLLLTHVVILPLGIYARSYFSSV